MTGSSIEGLPWWRRAPRLPLLLSAGSILGLLALLAAPALVPNLLRMEHQSADWRTALLSDRATTLHPDVAVVLINEETLEEYPYSSPIDRGLLAKVVRGLDAAKARVIGLDVFFAKRTEDVKDEDLVTAIRDAKAKVVLGALDERGLKKDNQRAFQTYMITASGRQAGFVNLKLESDGVARFRARARPGSAFPESFPQAIVKASAATSKATSDRIEWLLPPPGEQAPFLTLAAEALFDGTPANREAVARGQLKALENKIVLVGGDFPYRDQHLTPLAALGGQEIPGVMIHAQAIAQMLDGRSRTELAGGLAHLLLLALAAGGFAVGWIFGERHGYLFGWGVATAVLVAIDAMVFSGLRVILPFTLSLIAWVLGAAAGSNFSRLMSWHRETGRVQT